MFNALISWVKGLDQGTSLLIILGIIVLVSFCIYIVNKVISKHHENNLKNNPSKLGPEHSGRYFKVSEVCDGTNSICLADDPSIEYPLGKEKKWFDKTLISKELCEEGKVFQVTYKNGVIFCTKCPVF